MQKIVVDSSMQSVLTDSGTELHLVNDRGETIGYFFPSQDADPSRYGWLRSQLTEEELDHARQEQGGYTTDEVVSRLREQ